MLGQNQQLKEANLQQHFQFLRKGYFYLDKDSTARYYHF
jgi:hypothetical protein